MCTKLAYPSAAGALAFAIIGFTGIIIGGRGRLLKSFKTLQTFVTSEHIV